MAAILRLPTGTVELTPILNAGWAFAAATSTGCCCCCPNANGAAPVEPAFGAPKLKPEDGVTAGDADACCGPPNWKANPFDAGAVGCGLLPPKEKEGVAPAIFPNDEVLSFALVLFIPNENPGALFPVVAVVLLLLPKVKEELAVVEFCSVEDAPKLKPPPTTFGELEAAAVEGAAAPKVNELCPVAVVEEKLLLA